MILLMTVTNELEAQLLESRLKSNGVDCRLIRDEGPGLGSSDGTKIMVFEDDLDLAREIMDSQAFDDDDVLPGIDTDTDLDEFAGDL